MGHIMEDWAERHLRAVVAIREDVGDGIDAVSFSDKGSLIQLVTDRLLRDDASLLFEGRRRLLEHDWPRRCEWMVRDGWFQWPIIALWRLSQLLWKGRRLFALLSFRLGFLDQPEFEILSFRKYWRWRWWLKRLYP